MSDCTKESGTCKVCQGACTMKPGWMMPGDAERLAEHLGESVAELFRAQLAVDWLEPEGEFNDNVFVLAPALVGREPGSEYPGDPGGTCVFFSDGRCSIHEAKPFECHEYVCADSHDDEPARGSSPQPGSIIKARSLACSDAIRSPPTTTVRSASGDELRSRR